MNSARYGYVITSTPGTLSDGKFPLSAKGILAGEVDRGYWLDSDCNEPIAVFGSVSAAESAMESLVPDGSTPSVYAGLSVEPAWNVVPDEIANGVGLQGMDGFVVPEFAAV